MEERSRGSGDDGLSGPVQGYIEAAPRGLLLGVCNGKVGCTRCRSCLASHCLFFIGVDFLIACQPPTAFQVAEGMDLGGDLAHCVVVLGQPWPPRDNIDHQARVMAMNQRVGMAKVRRPTIGFALTC